MKGNSILIFNALYLPHVGGVERYVHNLAIRLVKKGCDVKIVCCNTDNAPEKEITPDGFKVYRLPCWNFVQSRFPVPKPFKKTFDLWKEIREINADFYLINMRFYSTSVLGVRLAGRKNKPSAVLEHVTGYMKTSSSVFNFFGRHYENIVTNYMKKRTGKFLAISKACAGWLEYFGIKAEGLVYNGVNFDDIPSGTIDFKQKYSLPENARIIGFAGRLIREKGIELLIKAYLNIRNTYPDICLLIAGEGEMYSEFISKYTTKKHGIYLLGRISHPDVLSLFELSEVVVNPSCYPEGLPTMLLEAGMMGTAVITTDLGGSAEVIINNDYGLLIEPYSVSAIEEAIRKMLDNNDYRKHCAENLKRLVSDKFNWEKSADELIRIIRQ